MRRIFGVAPRKSAVIDIRPLALDGLVEIIPDRFGDDRGFFSETWNSDALSSAGLEFRFVQDNHSFSAARGIVRGLHYQLPPFAQDKLVRVSRGAIFDVAVDLRRTSPSFGQWEGLLLSAEKWNQLLVPRGFAHAFVTMEDNTEVQYKVTSVYSAPHDRGIRFDDPRIGIEWPNVGPFQLSAKDKGLSSFAEAELPEDWDL